MEEYRLDTIRKSTIQFLNIFNDISVSKYDKNGNITQTFQVPLKLAGKQKFYYWLYDRKHSKRYPQMAASPKGMEPAIGDRGRNQKLSFTNPSMEKIIQTPTPYNINFELALVTNYIEEANQVLEQILPYFHPYVMTTVGLPEVGIEFDQKVVLNSISEDRDFEMPEDNYRTFSWIFDFTAHTFMFKPIRDTKLIETIYLNYVELNGDPEEDTLERHKITEDGIEIINYELLHGLEKEDT